MNNSAIIGGLKTTPLSVKKFIVYAPPWDENSGGHIALHKLCHLLNQIGHTAFIYPSMPSFELHPFNINQVHQYIGAIYEQMLIGKIAFKTNPDLNTPVISPNLMFNAADDFVVIYPETVFGNPLNAKNIVRWLLYVPGLNNGKIYYANGELHFLFHKIYDKFPIPNCSLSKLNLDIYHLPISKYLNLNKDNSLRSGTAYCLRKGKGREIVHDLADSILIDGKSHDEISQIFKNVKTFYSYDLYTQYSMFAVLAGCDSIVIPESAIDIDQWFPDEDQRLGIAYGFNELEKARATRDLLLEHYAREDREAIDKVALFVEEVSSFFKIN